MDLYDVLKVHPRASQAELDRAYQKLIRDARYDTTINQKDIEVAYRTLSDGTQRALYDATLASKGKRVYTRRVAVTLSDADRQKRLYWVLGILFVLAIAYYPIRFSYALKSFDVGDTLYYKDTDSYFGKVLQKESNHNFGPKTTAAYLVKTDLDVPIWFPADDVKVLCKKK